MERSGEQTSCIIFCTWDKRASKQEKSDEKRAVFLPNNLHHSVSLLFVNSECWEVYLTEKKSLKRRHSCMTAFTKKPKISWTTSCSCIQTVAAQMSGCTDRGRGGPRVWGLRRQEMCEMAVWQAEWSGWRERANGRWRWQETKAEIAATTAMMVVIWLSAWKSFCSFQPSDYKQQQQKPSASQCNENQLTHAAQQNTVQLVAMEFT